MLPYDHIVELASLIKYFALYQLTKKIHLYDSDEDSDFITYMTLLPYVEHL